MGGFMTRKFPRGEPWTRNFSALSYIDLEDRPAFKMAIHRHGDRWFLYAAHFWESGYSIEFLGKRIFDRRNNRPWQTQVCPFCAGAAQYLGSSGPSRRRLDDHIAGARS